MHTYHHDETNISIHHNGDYSGDALVVFQEQPVIEEHTGVEGTYYVLRVPCAPLAQFARWAVLSEVVSAVEELQ